MNNSINLHFARQLTGIYCVEWIALVQQFSSFQLSNINDHLQWRWNVNGTFSVHSLYSWMEYGGIPRHFY